MGVACLVVDAGRLLLMRRRGSHGAGTWSTPGGHLDQDLVGGVVAVQTVERIADLGGSVALVAFEGELGRGESHLREAVGAREPERPDGEQQEQALGVGRSEVERGREDRQERGDAPPGRRLAGLRVQHSQTAGDLRDPARVDELAVGGQVVRHDRLVPLGAHEVHHAREREDDPEGARRAVLGQMEAGVDVVAVTPVLSAELYVAVARAAREVGLLLGGEAPIAGGLELAVREGQASIDNLVNVLFVHFGSDLDRGRLGSAAELLGRGGISVTTAISSFDKAVATAGKQKIVDTAGRVDRFRRKYGL